MSKRKEPPEEATADASDDEDPKPRHETDPQNFVDGCAAVHVYFGSPGNAFGADHPEFVHQIFEPDGSIACTPSESVKINIVYDQTNLDFVADYEEEVGDASSKAYSRFIEKMPDAARKGMEDFCSDATFTEITGEPLASMNYMRNGKSYDVFASSLGSEAPAARKRFHERLQTLFRFAIETSSAIDGSDERWRVLTIYERDAGGEHRLVGACTLFLFQRWLAGSGPVKLLRICQVTTLPPFRKQGHGAKMLQAVYEYAKSVDALEVTVEDPNETFRLVRDKVDLQNGRKYIESHPHKEEPSALITERKALKLTEEQMARVSEMRTLQTLRSSGKTSADDSEMKSFRLLVKKRLSRKHKEELDAMLSLQKRQKEQEDAEGGGGGESSNAAAAAANDGPPTPSKEELVAMKKERLEELWQELLAEYEVALKGQGNFFIAAPK